MGPSRTPRTPTYTNAHPPTRPPTNHAFPSDAWHLPPSRVSLTCRRPISYGPYGVVDRTQTPKPTVVLLNISPVFLLQIIIMVVIHTLKGRGENTVSGIYLYSNIRASLESERILDVRTWPFYGGGCAGQVIPPPPSYSTWGGGGSYGAVGGPPPPPTFWSPPPTHPGGGSPAVWSRTVDTAVGGHRLGDIAEYFVKECLFTNQTQRNRQPPRHSLVQFRPDGPWRNCCVSFT